MHAKYATTTVLALLFTIIIILFIGWGGLSLKKIPDLNYLSFIVAVLAMITTINIALAAYKIVSAKSVEDEIKKRYDTVVSRLSERFDEEIEIMKNDVDLYKERHINDLSKSIDEMSYIIQDRAIDVIHEMKLENTLQKENNKVIGYVNVMDKENIAILKMILETLSSKNELRLKGFQELSTIKTFSVRKFFEKRLITEDSRLVRSFIIQELKKSMAIK